MAEYTVGDTQAAAAKRLAGEGVDRPPNPEAAARMMARAKALAAERAAGN